MKIKINKFPMLASIKKWLAPPVFENDVEKTRRASFINISLLIALSFMGITIPVYLFDGITRAGIGYALLVLFFALLFLYYLLQHGKVALTGSGVMILVFLYVIVVEIINGTVLVPITLVYLLVIITAGMLFEWRGTLISVCICSLAVLGLILAENANILPQPVHTVTLISWITYSGLFGLIGAVSLWGQRNTQQALGRAEQEIKARQRVELELRKLTRAVEQSPASIMIADLAGNIEYVNPSFTQVTGYSSDEAVGKNPRFLKTDFTAPETHIQLWQSITQGKEWHGEFVNRKKDGTIYYESAAISAITGANGVTTHYLAVKEDITERKHAEAVLVETALEREAALEKVSLYKNELELQNTEKAKRAAELLIANLGLTYQNEEKEKRAAELVIANRTLEETVIQRQAALETVSKYKVELEAQNTELYDKQTQLENLRKRYFDLYDLAPVGYCTINADGLILEANLTAANLLGGTRTSLLNYPLSGFIEKNYQDLYYFHRKKFVETGASQVVELQLVRQDRTIFWAQLETSFSPGDKEQPQARVLISDISERKRAEDTLAQTAARLSLAVRAGGVGTWEYDILHDRLIWDDQMYRLYGITAQDFSGAYDAWQQGLHPQNRERGDNEVQAALRGEKEYDTEFRVVWPDGSVHDLRALALVRRDQAGEPISMVGTNWDITFNKQAQEQIAELGRSNQTLLNTVTDGIHVLNDRGKLVDANPAFSKMLGYTLDELKLLNVADWDVQWTPGELAIRVSELIDHPAMFETRHRRKDDVVLDVEINAVGVTIHGSNYLYASSRNISLRKASEEKIRLLNIELENLALTDFLTNLFNRRYFMLRGTEAVKRVMRNKEPLALLMLDIDLFKKVNDNYGHEMGDLAIQHVARVLKSSLREIDILARIGGEEFAVLLPNTGKEDATALAERVRKLMQDTPFETAGEAISITLSLGAAIFENGMADIDALLRNADAALYQAKRSGRNRVVMFQDNLPPAGSGK